MNCPAARNRSAARSAFLAKKTGTVLFINGAGSTLNVALNLAGGGGDDNYTDCQPLPPGAPPEAVSLKKLSPSSYPNFADDLDYDNLGQAIAQSIAYLQVVPSQREVEARAAAPTTVDPIQQTVAEELKTIFLTLYSCIT